MSKFLICECCNQTYLEEDMSKNNKNMCCCCWCFTRPKDKRIAELEEQLKNAIVPKFKVGQDLYIIDEFDYSIVPFEIDKILITENGVEIKSVEWEEWFTEDEFFITREEAQAKLEELRGE